MKIYLILVSLFFYTAAIFSESKQLRNPFKFENLKQPQIIIQKKSEQDLSELLSKWNIKSLEQDLIVIENPIDGQIRTIQIS